MTYPKIPITEKEKRLCVVAKTFDEFKKGYSDVVPKDVPAIDVYQRAAAVWRHRRSHLAAIRIVDNQIKIERDEKGKFSSTRTEQAILVDVLNEIRLINRRFEELGNMKDTLAAVRDIHDLMLRVAAQSREQKQPVHP